MKKTDLAYVAGIFDGEGCVCIYKQKVKTTRRGFSYGLCIDVANTDEWLCRYLHFSFGGCLRRTQRKLVGREANWKPIWHWKLHGSPKCKEFLELILPYLKIRRPQAEIAIQFAGLSSTNRRNFRAYPKSEEELAVEEAKRIMMQAMNKRGVN